MSSDLSPTAYFFSPSPPSLSPPPPPPPPPPFQGVYKERFQQLRKKLKLKLPRGNAELVISSPIQTPTDDEIYRDSHSRRIREDFPDFTAVTNVDMCFDFSGPTIFDQSDCDRWQVVEYGCAGTLRYRLLLADKNGDILSPWHDIPLHKSPSCPFQLPNFLSTLNSSSPSTPLSLSSRSSSSQFSSPSSSSVLSPSSTNSSGLLPSPPSSCPSLPHSLSFSHFSSSSIFRFVCTTPAGTWLQCQVASQEPFSPLKMKNVGGVPARYSENTEWNLGLLPQTWSGSFCRIRKNCTSRPIGLPVEAIDIGTRVAWTGEVYGLKILAAVLVVEEGVRTCWRIVGISEDDVLAKKINGLADIHTFLPGRMESVQSWLWCQTNGKKVGGDKNPLSPLIGQTANEKAALQVVQRAHATWHLHMASPGQRPRGESLLTSADAYEATWQRCTSKFSDVSMPLCEQQETAASEIFEHAWIRSTSSEIFSENFENWEDLEGPENSKNFGRKSTNSKSFGRKSTNSKKKSKNSENSENSGNLKDFDSNNLNIDSFCNGLVDGSFECSESKVHSCPFSETGGTNLYRDFFIRKCANANKKWPALKSIHRNQG